MKKVLFLGLMVAISVAITSGCSKNENVENTTDENVAVEKTGTKVAPLPATVDIKNLNDCTVNVAFEKGDIYVDENGSMQLKADVYTYDLYDMVDIAALKKGDVIIRDGEEVVITELKKNDTGLININGGEENGGFDLISDDSTVYYEIKINDCKAYYLLGEAIIPVSTEFICFDESNPDGEKKEYYPGDFVTDDVDIEYNFVADNTEIVIQNGQVIQMRKYYMP